MDFSIEKYISNFVESQFPLFYQEEGPDFILFVKAYYEWLESSDNPIYQARRLKDYRDIDNTLEKFLEHFQRKYLYGIPFSTIANKRFLLKNILDVYRSKGTIQSYKLLFKLLYNQDVEVYLPGADVLRVSDGTWREPQYLEVTDNGDLNALIGKTVIGVSSGTTAVVENYTKKQFNADIINTVYISSVFPKGGDFNVGEKIVVLGQQSNVDAVTAAPYLMGSLDHLQILNGGSGFNIGDSIKIVSRNLTNNQILSYGVDGVVRVDSTSKGVNSLSFNIVSGGGGFLSNAVTFVYKQPGTSGNGASFSINNLTTIQNLTYNTDLICDYMSLQIGATAYGFPGNTSGNSTSNTLAGMLTFANDNFGTIGGLTNIKTGNSYAAAANVFVRSVQISSTPPVINVTANSIGFSNTTDTIVVTSANSRYQIGDRLYYSVPTGNTPIAPLTGNTYYYVSFANTTTIALSTTSGGANIDITDTRVTATGEVHTIQRASALSGSVVYSNKSPVFYTITANTTGFSNTAETILISSANTNLSVGDSVYYSVPTGNTPIAPLTGNTFFFISFANTSAICLASTYGGANINITDARTANGESHQLQQIPAVIGTSTIFNQIYANGDVIHLRANSSITSQDEIEVIRQVVNSTLIVLYGPPTYSSTASAQYRAAPSIVPSQFAQYETPAKQVDGSLNGLNDNIQTSVSAGNGIIGTTKLINSGKAYKDGEEVLAYLYSGVSNNITISSSGSGYVNGEALIFSGGSPTAAANGYINVNSNGAVTNAVVTFNGSGYIDIPSVRIKTANGSGATFTASLTEYNTASEVTGRIVKRGIGKARGYWSTTRGFLNSDKYIQDSYYYQDYSYELRVASILDKYKNILYNTFHSTGSELFGKFLLIDSSSSNLDVLFTSYSNATPTVYLTSDITTVTSDSNTVTVDKYYIS
jgi:hypothetical protein